MNSFPNSPEKGSDPAHQKSGASLRRRWGPFRTTITLLILACAVYFLYRLLDDIGPQKVLQAALDANPLLLFLTLIAVAARYWIWSLKWYSISRRIFTGIRATLCFPCLLCGAFTDLVTPFARTAGGFLRCYLLASRCSLPALRLYGTTLRDQVTNITGFWMLSFFALALFPLWYGDRAHPYGTSIARQGVVTVTIVGIAGTLALLAAVIFRKRLGRILSRPDFNKLLIRLYPLFQWIPGVRRRFETAQTFADTAVSRGADIFSPLLKSEERRLRLPQDIGVGALLYLCLCTGNYFAFLACGARSGEVPLFMVIAIFALGNLAGLLSTIPGGIGVTEASLIGLHILMGVRPELAAAANLLFRLTFYFFILSAGSLSLAWASRSTFRPAPDIMEARSDNTG